MKKLTTEEFIIKCKAVHGEKYDYSLVKYINCKTKVEIICKEHGIFNQEAHAHINKQGCSKCPGGKGGGSDRKLTIDILKERCYNLHKDEYSILSTCYINNHTKIMIKHNKCNHEWLVKPIHFSNGSGCPNCYNKSKGENSIKLFLEKEKIKYNPQYSFDDCRYKNRLSFDFYLPQYNTCIEYDGKQHFQPIEKFGGDNGFELTKIRDNIKSSYCENNKINLIRIPYTKLKKIEEILNNTILTH